MTSLLPIFVEQDIVEYDSNEDVLHKKSYLDNKNTMNLKMEHIEGSKWAYLKPDNLSNLNPLSKIKFALLYFDGQYMVAFARNIILGGNIIVIMTMIMSC